MKKSYLVILLGLIVIISALIIPRDDTASSIPPTYQTLTTSEASIPSEMIEATKYKEISTKKDLISILSRNERVLNFYKLQLNTYVSLEQRNTHRDICNYFIQQIERNNAIYQEQLENILIEEERIRKEALQHSPSQADCQQDKYAAATYIWNYLKDKGYNNYVCAGILGNIMTEVGGNTLYIQWWLYGDSYYGMCQWNRGYSAIWGTDLKTQCDFLMSNIEYEIDTFGFCYQSGFRYDNFCQLQNPQAAARCFAKAYERCGSGSYGIRESNALIAYNYFVG